MKLVFSDNGLHLRLAPFTLTKPVAELRFGILTFKETWLHFFDAVSDEDIFYTTEDYLEEKYPKTDIDNDTLTLAGNVKPTAELYETIVNLENDTALYCNGQWIASKGNGESKKEISLTILYVDKPWHLFQKNNEAISLDFALLSTTQTPGNLSATNRTIGEGNIFIAPGATVEHSILNASTGPIYIGENAEIMEGSVIRGPFALCNDATVKMSAKIYGATTIGPHCKVGGEISNAIFQAYSNKGHDGFLGNAVIGEWCNLGADTNASNLKNNYSPIKIYNYETQKLEQTSELFCGLLMGDHSKTGINTMLNTATVVGVAANVFGANFPPKHLPSFTWGGTEKESVRFDLNKVYEMAENMMKRRKVNLTQKDRNILAYLYDLA